MTIINVCIISNYINAYFRSIETDFHILFLVITSHVYSILKHKILRIFFKFFINSSTGVSIHNINIYIGISICGLSGIISDDTD